MTWREMLPHIAIGACVPVVDRHFGHWVVLCETAPDSARYYLADRDTPMNQDELKVDLSEPQGFSYAVRYFVHRTRAGIREEHMPGLRHFFDAACGLRDATDADRVLLAEAIAALPERACIHCEHRWTGALNCPKCGHPGEPVGDTNATP